MRAFTALKKHMESRPKTRKVIGISLVCIGVIALLTPFTPGAWLALIGLEMLGIRHFVETYRERSRKAS